MKTTDITKRLLALGLVCLSAASTVSCSTLLTATTKTELNANQSASMAFATHPNTISLESLNQTQPLTDASEEQDQQKQEEIYRLALKYLRTGYYESAYKQLSLIPEYKDASMYLARLHYKAQTLVIRDITDDPTGDGTLTYSIDTNLSELGFLHGEIVYDYTSITQQYCTLVQQIKDNADPTKNEKYGRPSLVQISRHPFFGIMTGGYQVKYDYVTDRSSRVKTETFIGLKSQDFDKNYTYNEDKTIQKINVTWTRNMIPCNYEFQYVYANGKLMQIKFADLSQGADPTPVEYANYSYNAKGQLTSITYPGGSVDPIEDLKLWTGTSNQWVAPVWNEENAYTITYTYNAKGQLATEVLNYKNSDNKDQSITYDEYNENDVLVQKTVTKTVPVTVDGVTELQLKTYRYTYTKIKFFYNRLG